MFSLSFVIGQVLNTIKTVGLVVRHRISLIGGDNSIVEQAEPVLQESKPRRKVAKRTSQGLSPTVETSPVPTPTKKSKAVGMSQARLAPQSAKQPQKSKPKVALKATKVASPTKGKKSAPKTVGRIGK